MSANEGGGGGGSASGPATGSPLRTSGVDNVAVASPLPVRAVAAVSSPWQADEEEERCSSCSSEFNLINRRHHCRLCGRLFCQPCSPYKSLIPPTRIVLKPLPTHHGAGGRGGPSFAPPEEDPDRMLTYLSVVAEEGDEQQQGSVGAAAAAGGESRSWGDENYRRTLLYGRGLEERVRLAQEPLRVCRACHLQLEPLQPHLISSNSHSVRHNTVDPSSWGRFFNSPVAFTLGHEIRKASYAVHNLLPVPRRLPAFAAVAETGIGGADFGGGGMSILYQPSPSPPCGPGNTGSAANLEGCVRTVVTTPNLSNLDGLRIPGRLLQAAHGLAFLTTFRAGFGIAGFEVGTGLVVARRRTQSRSVGGASSQMWEDDWSPPSAIGAVGASWGALVGAQVTDHVFLLMTNDAVRILFGPSSVTLGADVGVAAGPIGRSAEADWAVSAGSNAGIYTYSYSKGLYAGLSLDGKVVLTRNDVNEKFYGRKVTGDQILAGEVPVPPAAQPLYEALARCRHYAFASYSSSSSSALTTPSRSQPLHQDRPAYDPALQRYPDAALGYTYPPQGYPMTLPGLTDDPTVMGEYGETFSGGAGEEAGGFGVARLSLPSSPLHDASAIGGQESPAGSVPFYAAGMPSTVEPSPPPSSLSSSSSPPQPTAATPPPGRATSFQARPTIASLPPPSPQ